MKKNVGFTDKCVRMTVAITLSLLVFSHFISDRAAMPTFLLAFWLAVTCFRGVCPVYRLLRINTNKRKSGFNSLYEYQRHETLIRNYLKNYQEVHANIEKRFK